MRTNPTRSLTRVTAAVVATSLVMLLVAVGSTGTAFAGINHGSHSTGMTTPPKGDASKTLAIAKPGGVEIDDLMLAQITFEKGADAGTNAQLTPSGWTLVLRTNSKTDIGQAIFYRVATDSEPSSYSFPFRQAVKAAGGILRYTGVDTADPIVAAAGNWGDSNTLTAPSVSAESNSVLVSLFGFKKKTTTLSVPSGMTGRYNFQNPQDVTIRAADELRSDDSPTGTRVSTPSPRNSDKWVAQNVVLRNGNTPPEYTAPSNQNANEGEDTNFDLGSFADPDPHPSWEITVDWGNGSPLETFPVTSAGSLDRNHTYADDGTYTVEVTVDDGFETDSGSFEVDVANVAPTVTAANDQTSDEGENKTFDLGSFTDPGLNDGDWDVDVNWGDLSTADTFSVSSQGSLGTRTHTYASAGTYTVTVTVTDKDGDSGSDTFEVEVAPGQTILYLHNNPTPPTANTGRQGNLPMNTTAPTATTLFNYNTTDDSNAGVTGRYFDKISASDALSTTDLQKHQTWRWPGAGSTSSGLASNLVVNGDVELRIWAKLKASGKDIQLRAFLRNCDSTGANCNVGSIATLNMTRASISHTAFQELTLTASGVNATIDAGRTLQLRVVMLEGGNADPAYLAYDTTSYPARLILP